MGVALLATSGCKHGQVSNGTIPGTTRIPSAAQVGQERNGGLDNSVALPGPVTTPAEITPLNPNEPIPFGTNDMINALLNGPHNEDRTKFEKDTIYFETDSSTIKTSEQSKLEDVSAYMKDHKTEGLMIEGYCDERGTEGYNLSLGDHRALAIREYLVNLGVESGRIATKSLGEANPVDASHNEGAWKKNRRGLSILITPK